MKGTYHFTEHYGTEHEYKGQVQDANNSFHVTASTFYTGTYYCIVEFDSVRSDQSNQVLLRVHPQDPRVTGPTSVGIGEELVLDCTTHSGGLKFSYFYRDNEFLDVFIDKPYRKPMADAGDAGDYFCFISINGVQSSHNSDPVTIKVLPPTKPTLAINGVAIGLNHPAIYIDDRTELKFECTTTSTPTSAMKGFYHQHSHDGADHVYNGTQDASNSYTVTVATSYTGTYYCIVDIDSLRSDQSYVADLRVKPQEPTLTVTPPAIADGGDVEFMCIHQSSGGTYAYFKGLIRLTTFGTAERHTIQGVTPADTDTQYNCKVTVNDVVSDASQHVSLEVKPQEPTLTVTPPAIDDGGEVEFMCIHQSSGGTYAYFKGLIPLPTFGAAKVHKIQGVTPADTDTQYNCKVTVNGVQSNSSQHVSLQVHPLKPRLTGPTSPVAIGGELVLDCATDSVGVKTFDFYRDGTHLSGLGSSISPYRKPMTTSDVGNYTCTATISGVTSAASEAVTVEDVDECLEDPSPCLNGGVCISLPVTFYCKCPAGYFGQKCEKVSESGPLKPESSPADDPFYANKTLGYQALFTATSVPPIFGVISIFLLLDCCACFARKRIRERNPDEWRRIVRRRNLKPSLAITRMALDAMKPIRDILMDAFKPRILPDQADIPQKNKKSSGSGEKRTDAQKEHVTTPKQKQKLQEKIQSPATGKGTCEKSEDAEQSEIQSAVVPLTMREDTNNTEYFSLYAFCEALLKDIPEDDHDKDEAKKQKDTAEMVLVNEEKDEGSLTLAFPRTPIDRGTPIGHGTPIDCGTPTVRGTPALTNRGTSRARLTPKTSKTPKTSGTSKASGTPSAAGTSAYPGTSQAHGTPSNSKRN